jgi:disulfide bond formation protein DsbB
MFVWVIGLILAIVRWRKSPRKSILVLIGLSIMLLGGLTDIAQNYFAVQARLMMDYLNLASILSIAGVFLDTLGWVLCIIAIFIEDKKENEVK